MSDSEDYIIICHIALFLQTLIRDYFEQNVQSFAPDYPIRCRCFIKNINIQRSRFILHFYYIKNPSQSTRRAANQLNMPRDVIWRTLHIN